MPCPRVGSRPGLPGPASSSGPVRPPSHRLSQPWPSRPACQPRAKEGRISPTRVSRRSLPDATDGGVGGREGRPLPGASRGDGAGLAARVATHLARSTQAPSPHESGSWRRTARLMLPVGWPCPGLWRFLGSAVCGEYCATLHAPATLGLGPHRPRPPDRRTHVRPDRGNLRPAARNRRPSA